MLFKNRIYQKVVHLIQSKYRKILLLPQYLCYLRELDKYKTFYQLTGIEEVKNSRSSDTLFIFGSGYSINSISKDEFSYFEKFDTLSFSWFVHQNFVKIDFHLIRELIYNENDIFLVNSKLDLFKEKITDNKLYQDTIFLLQSEVAATTQRALLARYIFPKQSKMFFFKTKSRRKNAYPQNNIKSLIHSAGSLTDCIDFGYSMGYKKIVLVGIDLYDRRYFWLDYNEVKDSEAYRNALNTDTHNTAKPMMDVLKRWNTKFLEEGVQLYVYNPKSLLSEFLPVYDIKE